MVQQWGYLKQNEAQVEENYLPFIIAVYYVLDMQRQSLYEEWFWRNTAIEVKQATALQNCICFRNFHSIIDSSYIAIHPK